MDRQQHFTRMRAGWAIAAGGLLVIMALVAGCTSEPPTGEPFEVGGVEGFSEPGADETGGRAAAATMPPPATQAADAYYPEPTEEPASYEGDAAEAEIASGVSNSGEGDDALAPDEQRPVGPQNQMMVIKNGEISLLVENADVALDRATQIAADAGGYVISSQVWFNGDYKLATVTLGVPSDQFETAMRRLREIAMEVLAESSSGQDVSAEYVDLQSRLRNLEATRDRIMSFLDDARSVEEALLINQQLANIEAEIEQVRGRMNYLEGRSAYSTIVVNIEVPRPTPTPTPTATNTPTPTPTYTPTATATPTAWSPGRTLNSAMTTQTGLLRGLVEALIWLGVVIGPWVLIVGLIGLGANAVRRRRMANGNGGKGGSQAGGSASGGTPEP